LIAKKYKTSKNSRKCLKFIWLFLF
jgi:hypothetical protein